VDTLLLLRPTQSPVLFQQQIERGLRLAPNKENCLILDFVGQQRVDFRFDRLLSSLTGLSRRELVDGVENGFGSLPPGCHIQLQRQTREQVLQSLRSLTSQNWRRLRSELQGYATLRGRTNVFLADFLHDQALELEDIYRSNTSQGRCGWTALKRDAGLIATEPGPEEEYLSRRFADLLHVDDPRRLDVMAAVAHSKGQLVSGEFDPVGLQMLAYQIETEGYHHRIAYHDYAISADRFHWQTQNSAGPDTAAGRRYVQGHAEGWQFQLFVRGRRSDAYTACGPATLESAEGDRPMTIVWRLSTPLPARLFKEFSVLRGI